MSSSYVYYSFSLINNDNKIDEQQHSSQQQSSMNSFLNSNKKTNGISSNYCNCEYCSTIDLNNNSNIQFLNRIRNSIQLIDELKLNNKMDSFNSLLKTSKSHETNIKSLMLNKKSKSLDSLDKLNKNKSTNKDDHRLELKNDVHENSNGKYHHFCDYYLNMWRSEMFKSKALEKQNEKLESRVKYLEKKLDRETYSQIKISLEWRKTVTNLVDENTRLKSLLNSYKSNDIGYNSASTNSYSSSPIILKSSLSSSSFSSSS